MELQKYNDLHVKQIDHILNFLLARAKGDIPTGAKFIRDIIINNEFYKQDSKLSPSLISILIKQILNLHTNQNFCNCECNTSVDSADFKMEENKLNENKKKVS